MTTNDSILVVGAGFVGLATAAFLATKGLSVTVAEKNQFIVDSLRKGKLHFREPELAKRLKAAVGTGHLCVVLPSRDIYQKASIIIVAIDSADQQTWKMKLTAFERMAEWIGGARRKQPAVVLLKSTNILGFAGLFRGLLDQAAFGHEVQLVVNPEFLREGCAYEDTARPWRVVVGADDPKARRRVVRFYKKLLSASVPIIETDCASAELIKLGANLYLSHRLAFIHEIAEYAHLQSLDLAAIKQAIGLDPRIGTEYFEPGLGFGGSCLPKDCYLINSRESETGFTFHTAETALEINERVLTSIVTTLQSHLSSLKRKKIALLGAAFKPEADDTRGSRAVKLALKLRRRGATVAVYEPFLIHADQIVEGNLPLVHNLNEALTNAHVIVIGTAHRRFRNLRPKTVAALVKNKLVCDRFGLLNRTIWERHGFEFV